MSQGSKTQSAPNSAPAAGDSQSDKAAAANAAGLPEVLTLPTAIMELPCNRTMSHFATQYEMDAHKEGHRDARHAAADLVLERADELAALANRATATSAVDLPYTEDDLLELVGIGHDMRDIPHWKMQAGSKHLAVFIKRLHDALKDRAAAKGTAGQDGAA